jgi:hypothetical protein
MRKRVCLAVLVFGLVALPAVPALACGGLIGPRGAVNLTRTTTLAAHHNGVEHYITAFNYSGGGGEFGSIVPLPAMPSKVEKGGEWTLQRLRRETQPRAAGAAVVAASSAREDSAEEVYKTRIDALDITVLRGGGRSVGIWASEHGFRFPPDAPEVLDFYAKRSPYFMAAVFDAKAASERGQEIGDGTPIHITIPLRSPWVPLRILGLGKQASELVEADIYLLTDRVPNLLPAAGRDYFLERQVPASEQLLADLRSDRGMEWLPPSGMTLTHLTIDAPAKDVRHDLAINVNGGAPSPTRAGLAPPPTPQPTPVPTLAPTPVVTPVATAFEQALALPAKPARSAWPLAVAAFLVPIGGLSAWVLWRNRAGA